MHESRHITIKTKEGRRVVGDSACFQTDLLWPMFQEMRLVLSLFLDNAWKLIVFKERAQAGTMKSIRDAS